MGAPLDPSTARERFRAMAAGPDAAIDLAAAALWIAAEDDRGVDPDEALAELGRLAEGARHTLAGAGSALEHVTRLNRYLFEQQGFRGNRDDYYDPRNSFLHAVLERRSGIPITLCLVWIEVARRVGLDAHGVGFPGHFLAKVTGEAPGGEIVVDAFEGRVLSRADCETQLRSQFGPDARLTPELLAPTGPREILLRMLSNLKQIYLRKKQLEAAVACCDRMLLLAPDAALELRDRGLLHRALECFGPACDDLEHFLLLAPDHPSAAQVQVVLTGLRAQRSRLN